MNNVLHIEPQMVKKYSLCLIEDDTEIGNWLMNKFSAIDRIASIHWAQNFQQSKNYLKEEDPDIIILDLKLPDGNGIDILRTIKNENLDIKVFVFSSNTAFKNACLRLGAAGFFDKSTDGEKLIEALKSA